MTTTSIIDVGCGLPDHEVSPPTWKFDIVPEQREAFNLACAKARDAELSEVTTPYWIKPPIEW
jgi:hypothetical protein